MSLWNLIRKEMKELITPGSIISMALFAMIFVMMGSMIGGVQEQFDNKPVIGFVDQDQGEFSKIATDVIYNESEVIYNGSDVDEGLKTVKKEGGVALLIISENFTENILNNRSGEIEIYWIMRGTGLADSISPTLVNWLIFEINVSITKYMIDTYSDINSSVALKPIERNETTIVKGVETKGISPAQISAVISGQTAFIPLIMMMVILLTGSMMLSSMGQEKENKTLETLLTLPIKRSSIIAGKIIGSTIVGLFMSAIYMIGFVYYMVSLQSSSDIDLEKYGLALDPLDYVLVGLSMFFAILAGLALCMLLGIFVKNIKTAQTLTLPITALTLVPMVITMVMDFDTAPAWIQAVLFIIPFSHPMMAVRALIFDNYLFVIAGILYSAIFSFIIMAVAVWIINSDVLLVGRIKKQNGPKRKHLFK